MYKIILNILSKNISLLHPRKQSAIDNKIRTKLGKIYKKQQKTIKKSEKMIFFIATNFL